MKLLNKISSTWLTFLWGFFICLAHYLGTPIDMSITFYLLWTYVLLIFLIPIIGVTFNEVLMAQVIMPTIIVSREDAIKIVNEEKFFDLPIIFHVMVGVYFLMRVGNPFLSMAFFSSIFYFRVSYLLVRSCIVRHLRYMDIIAANK